jgi:4-amino-4-deoxy-L-arabinose transferase
LVFATTLMPLASSQSVSTDYLLTAALAVAQACFWEGVRNPSRLAVHLFWFFMGVAFLVKGPPSLLVIPAVLIVWRRLPQLERGRVPLFAPTALALFLAVGLGWYAWEAWLHPGLMGYWLKDEVVNRAFSDKFLRNPFFYCNFTVYLPVLLFGSLPWSGWLALRWRRVWERVRVSGGLRNLWVGLPVETHWLIWAVALPLCVFALSRSKLPLYVLPVFVPLAVATGRLLLAAYGQEAWFGKWARATAYATLAFFVVGKAVVGGVPNKKDMGQLYRTLTEQYGVLDPERLAIVGDKTLNGLSYYYDRDLEVVPLDQAGRWADAGEGRFLLCSYRLIVEAKQLLGSRVAEEHALTPWQYVLQLKNPAFTSGQKQ